MRLRQIRNLARSRTRDRDAIAGIVQDGMGRIYGPMRYADPYPLADRILTYLEVRYGESLAELDEQGGPDDPWPTMNHLAKVWKQAAEAGPESNNPFADTFQAATGVPWRIEEDR